MFANRKKLPNRKDQVTPTARLIGLSLMALFMASCAAAPNASNVPSILDPRGHGARVISQEWWILFSIGTAVVVLISLLLMAILIRHFRIQHHPTLDPQPTTGMRWIWLGGIVLPLIILPIGVTVVIRDIQRLSAAPSEETFTVALVGHRWWWEVQYPDKDFVTANQIYVPVGQSVHITLNSADVIHSFWVPQLHFKEDLIPGHPNSTWIQADEPGIYRGLCAEFCGLQHAQMDFTVVALTADRYQAWLETESKDAATPESEPARIGQQVFLSSSCIFCHTIRGTAAVGEIGPDLTHFASRLTLASGALDNNLGNLGGWILDPQHIKPGSLMPATQLSGEQLQALLAYLSTLQ